MDLNELSHEVIGAAIEVHSYLGPGLLEPSYQAALSHELTLRKVAHRCEVSLPLVYKGLTIPNAYRIDILAEKHSHPRTQSHRESPPSPQIPASHLPPTLTKTPRPPHQLQSHSPQGRHPPHHQFSNSLLKNSPIPSSKNSKSLKRISATTPRPLRLCVEKRTT